MHILSSSVVLTPHYLRYKSGYAQVALCEDGFARGRRATDTASSSVKSQQCPSCSPISLSSKTTAQHGECG
eukprot:1249691-Pyramimonas_sp.AAC.1